MNCRQRGTHVPPWMHVMLCDECIDARLGGRNTEETKETEGKGTNMTGEKMADFASSESLRNLAAQQSAQAVGQPTEKYEARAENLAALAGQAADLLAQEQKNGGSK